MKEKMTLIDNSAIFDRRQVDDILDETKSTLFDLNVNKTIINRVFSVAVECLDNILKHSEIHADEGLKKEYPSRFILEKDGEAIVLNTMNLVLNKYVKELTERLNKVKIISPEDLIQLYKLTLTKAEISEKGGAGLGLITIAKISRQRIVFDFKKVNEKFSYFALKIEFYNISK